jgi:hypothetical protein
MVSTPAPAHSAADARSARANETSLGAERALIDMARTAVARSQGDAALPPLERHAREFPNGRLAEERDWLRIQALLLLRRTDEANARAVAFRRMYPRSLMLPALDQVIPQSSNP